MGNYKIHVPDFVVKGQANAAAARTAGESKIAKHKAGLTATLLGTEPAGPPIGADPRFLTPADGSSLIFHDPCTAVNPIPIWGAWAGARVDNPAPSAFTGNFADIRSGRLAHFDTGGPDNKPYRELTVHPEDVNWSAARDALGYNWWDPADDGGYPSLPHPGPTVLWRDGQRRMLHLWTKFGAINNTGNFRQLFEIKQCEPFSGAQTPGFGFPLELQQRNDGAGPIWLFSCWWEDTWVVPVTQDPEEWIPFSVEMNCSSNPALGWVKFKVGDEVSPIFHMQTVLVTADNGPDHPSFMEMGPYQATALPTATFGYGDIRVYG